MQPVVTELPILIFDGSFEGWLSAVFTVYQRGWQHSEELSIVAQADERLNLWRPRLDIVTDEQYAQRVSKKLEHVFGQSGMRQLLWGFLSEHVDVYTQLFGIVRYQLRQPTINVWDDIIHPDVMAVSKLIKMVGRERHRMQAFVRFEHTEHDIYFARIEPDFNVLPIVYPHFKSRYADQNWAIYDLKRGYGVFYQKNDSDHVHLITDIDEDALINPRQLYSEREHQYQRLWQKYFNHVTIKERLNRKVHLQHLPRRYWKYLTEKQPFSRI